MRVINLDRDTPAPGETLRTGFLTDDPAVAALLLKMASAADPLPPAPDPAYWQRGDRLFLPHYPPPAESGYGSIVHGRDFYGESALRPYLRAIHPSDLVLLRVLRELEIDRMLNRARLTPAQFADLKHLLLGERVIIGRRLMELDEAASWATRPRLLGYPIRSVKSSDPLAPDEIIRRIRALAAEAGYTLLIFDDGQPQPGARPGIVSRIIQKVKRAWLRKKTSPN